MQCIVLCIIIESTVMYAVLTNVLERRSVMSHNHGSKISGTRQRTAQETTTKTMRMAKKQ